MRADEVHGCVVEEKKENVIGLWDALKELEDVMWSQELTSVPKVSFNLLDGIFMMLKNLSNEDRVDGVQEVKDFEEGKLFDGPIGGITKGTAFSVLLAKSNNFLVKDLLDERIELLGEAWQIFGSLGGRQKDPRAAFADGLQNFKCVGEVTDVVDGNA